MDMASGSAGQEVKAMLLDAMMGVQAASEAGREATARIEGLASNPELKAFLQDGSKRAETWRERLSAASQTMGGATPLTEGNPITDAIQQVGMKIMHKATDPVARDLGIIASGQLALHYYISAFGTMSAYAKMLGLDDVAQSIHACLHEAKQGDEHYTELATKLVM